MNLSSFDYHIPEELIAQRPLEKREQSRMMVVHRKTGQVEHKFFLDLPSMVSEKDLLVFNQTRVRKARLLGNRQGSGGRVEFFLLHQRDEKTFECLVKATASQKENMVVQFGEFLEGKILSATNTPMIYVAEFTSRRGKLEEEIDHWAKIPLPPYIHRDPDAADLERYQTVYAKELGSVAAPTAGLHFTPEVLEDLKKTGAGLKHITLHVGLGTFQPIKVENLAEHKMHREDFFVPEDVRAACQSGKRVIAVGTTAVRALESAARGFDGSTELFLQPGSEFLWVDSLFTNFHQPKSSLAVMVSGFMGSVELLKEAYAKAVEEKYRFFSYGDCMWVVD